MHHFPYLPFSNMFLISLSFQMKAWFDDKWIAHTISVSALNFISSSFEGVERLGYQFLSYTKKYGNECKLFNSLIGKHHFGPIKILKFNT